MTNNDNVIKFSDDKKTTSKKNYQKKLSDKDREIVHMICQQELGEAIAVMVGRLMSSFNEAYADDIFQIVNEYVPVSNPYDEDESA